jgi:hypothetical protein
VQQIAKLSITASTVTPSTVTVTPSAVTKQALEPETHGSERELNEGDESKQQSVDARGIQKTQVKDILEVHHFSATDEIIKSQYPALLKHSVSLDKCEDIKKVFRDITRLAQNLKSTNLLRFPQRNDKSKTFLPAPTSSSLMAFKKNGIRTKFQEQLLKAFIPEKACLSSDYYSDSKDEDGDIDESAVSEEEIARFAFLTLGRKHQDEFVVAADKLGLPVHRNLIAEKLPVRLQCGRISISVSKDRKQFTNTT